MSSANDLVARRAAVVPRGVGQFAPLATVVSASGAALIDADGHEVIDFTSGIGVTGTGHCPPQVVKAIQEQAARLLHICIHCATYEPYVALCEALASLFPHAPGNNATKVFLCNTGAEAVENAVKIARQATGRPNVICFSEAFHGRTMLALTMTSKVGYKTGCGPFATGVHRLPFPNRFKYGQGQSESAFVEHELLRLRQAFTTHVPAAEVAAIILEPVQGEGGFVPAPSAYLKGIREICTEHGILLILDEVQTGFFRTGKWAAYHHAGVTPDISTWAKSLGAGMPIAAVVGRADVMDKAAPGTLGGTYGGNPVACAAALANIHLMRELELEARAAKIATAIRTRFDALQRRCPAIGDVRGLGPMLAIEFVEGGDPNRPAPGVVPEIIKSCLQRGVLLASAGVHGNCIRILCPLVISPEMLDRGLTIVEEEVLRIAGGTAR